MSVRSNHLDPTHLHLMPPFTWMMPTKGIDLSRMDKEHQIRLTLPATWTVSSQLIPDTKVIEKVPHRWCFTSPNRDHFIDSIIEANPNEPILFEVDGREHHLKIWDSGGFVPHPERLEQFILDMKKIISEHHALFGIPPWNPYTIVLQLTESGRGGLEHMNSQTSMMPRTCLMMGFEDEYRDLISLFSHEYLHQWNVKRLRPKNFIDYDLQNEAHTDLLWWFEGGTSWLGDMMCIRSGAWSEDDWKKDFERKMTRHLTLNGSHHESLCESSHDAWIHLYRSGPYSRETQISYYLEGELAMMCLDAELRRRNHNTFGACDLMATLCHKFALDVPGSSSQGIDYSILRSTLLSVPGGSRMGAYLDALVKERHPPPIQKALSYFKLTLKEKVVDEKQTAWLGVSLHEANASVTIRAFHRNSPLRSLCHVGDEILAIDSVRVQSITQLQSYLAGKQGTNFLLTVCHEGITSERVVTGIPPMSLATKLHGKGNEHWKAYISSRQ